MEEKLKVVVCEVGKYAKEEIIDSSLESMQKKVQGYIEAIDISDDACIVCNEEGKIDQLPFNRATEYEDGSIKDVLVGNFFIVGQDEWGEFKSLTDKQVEKYIEQFKRPEQIVFFGNRLRTIPYDPREEKIAVNER